MFTQLAMATHMPLLSTSDDLYIEKFQDRQASGNVYWDRAGHLLTITLDQRPKRLAGNEEENGIRVVQHSLGLSRRRISWRLHVPQRAILRTLHEKGMHQLQRVQHL
jgi:hypothetical protein